MRLAHKRKVQTKLNKRLQVITSQITKTAPQVKAKVVESVKKQADSVVKLPSSSLTPKQQQVLDIVAAHAEGINPKGIGLAAGQEDTKAASWATGALKKLLEEQKVERVALSGNKVIYKLK